MSTEIQPDASGRLLTYEQLRQRRDSLRNRQVRIVNINPERTGGRYWRENYNGHTDDIARAGVFAVPNVIRDNVSPSVVYELVDDTAQPFEPPKERTLLSAPQAAACLDKIGDKMCRLVVWDTHRGDHMKYWRRPLGTGVSSDLEQSLQMRVSTVVANQYQNCKIDMLDQEMAAEIAKLPFRKCSLAICIPTALVLSLQLQPNNPTYRALLLRRFGVMPPTDVTTFEALKDWIEFNCDPPPQGEMPIPTPTPPPPPPPVNRYVVRLAFSDSEYGRCRYSVHRTGQGDYGFSEDDIRQIVSEASDFEEVIAAVEHKISDRAWTCSPQMHEGERFDYEQYEEEGTQEHQFQHRDSQALRRNRLMSYLFRILLPEEQQRIGIRAEEPTPQPTLQQLNPDPFPIEQQFTQAVQDEPLF